MPGPDVIETVWASVPLDGGPAPDRVRPFHCGTQYADWQESNCRTCRKAAPPDAADFADVPCRIELALIHAYLGDGDVTAEIADAMGLTANPLAYGWRCGEHQPPFMNVKPDGTVDPKVKKPASDDGDE
jgi:hypothetical protein